LSKTTSKKRFRKRVLISNHQKVLLAKKICFDGGQQAQKGCLAVTGANSPGLLPGHPVGVQ
jgi:hypothetical protein